MFEFSSNPKTNIAYSVSQLYCNNTHQPNGFLFIVRRLWGSL